MIICIIGYVVLHFFSASEAETQKFFVWCEEKTGRQILLILFCANTIALGLFWLDRQEKIQEKSSGMSMAAEADERLMRSRSDRH